MTHPDSTVEAVAKACYDRAFLKHAPEDVDRWDALVADRYNAAESWREIARAALSAIPRPTESEVATAVYRHFTTPSREQIARAVNGTDQSVLDDEDYDAADRLLALFEQNGAEHE